MRRGTPLFALIALVLAGGPAFGKDESPKDAKPKDEASKDASATAPHPRYVATLEDAMAEARERDCLVVVSIHEDGWHACVEQHRSVLENEEFAKWATENVILVMAHPKGKHKPVDVVKPAKGEPKTTCPLYPGIPCDAHERVFAEFTGLGDEFGSAAEKPKAKPSSSKVPLPSIPKSNEISFPTTYVVTPDAKPEKADRWGAPEQWIEKLTEAQKSLDEHPIPWSKLAGVRKACAEAEKAAKANQWKPALAAIGRADTALSGAWCKPLESRVKAWLDAANAKAVSRFADAKRFKDDASQVRGVKAVREEFGQAMTAGPLPVIADVDAWLSEHGGAPAAPPAK